MTLKSSSTQRKNANRTRPVLEGLEERKLLSRAALGVASTAVSSVSGLTQDGRVFSYTTPTGGHATISVVGIGTLAGTSLNASGALELVYGGTNAYTKIVGTVRGGGGHAPLASIENSQLIASGAQNSLSGVGGNVVQSFLLSPFDLMNGGRINLTSGVTSLILDSIGADTQINLRALPPAPSTQTVLPTSTLLVGTSPATVGGTSSVTIFRAFATETTTTSSQEGTTLEALQSTTVTNPYGVSTTYVTNGNAAQTLTSVSGEFKSAGNIVEPLPAADPIQTVPPAPPGVILKVKRIKGDLSAPVNVQKDPKIFGYDPVTGDIVEFDLNLDTRTGVLDPQFTKIPVPGDPAVAGLDLGWLGSTRVLMFSSGSTVYVYNPQTEVELGQFTTVGSFMNGVNVNSVAGTDTLNVLGSYQTNKLYAIDLASSLATNVAQPATGFPITFSPQAQFTLLGGLTSSPGTNSVFATIAAHLDTTQPNMVQLGIQAVSTAAVASVKGQGSVLSNALSALANTSVQVGGAFINVPIPAVPPVPPVPPVTSPPGPALGSIDQSLALVLGVANGKNILDTENGTFTLTYPNPLAGLSETYRPSLAGSALIDVQGTLESIRGDTAKGMVLNDTGNLNLVKFGTVKDSTIVGQPIGHLEIANRSNNEIQSSKRVIKGRNDVKVDKQLKTIGPLTQPNDLPVSDY